MEKETWHGTRGGYSNHKCRCDECRVVWNQTSAEYRRKRREQFDPNEPTIEHGKTYAIALGCKCPKCSEFGAIYHRQIRVARMGAPDVPDVCDCCARESGVALVMDHDHTTGLFRGWLCHGCNTAIGKLGDTVDGVRRAVDYLERANKSDD